MTIIHVDTACAAGSGGNPANELSLPAEIRANGSSSPWSAWAIIVLFGDTNDADEGTYLEEESPSYSNQGSWLSDTSDTNLWLVRLVNATEYGSPSNPLNLRFNAAQWTSGRSNWEALGIGWNWTNLSQQTSLSWGAGWSYGQSGEGVFGTLEFAKGATGLLKNFTNANVSTGLDTITITGHSFSGGDAVLFKDGGGTPPSPLVNNGLYYVYRQDANTIKLGTSMNNIDTTPSYVNLTTTGSGTFSLTRVEAHGSCGFDLEAND